MKKTKTPTAASKLAVTHALMKLANALAAEGRILPGIEFVGEERVLPESNSALLDPVSAAGDVPPKIWTILSWNFPVVIPDPEMESSDEGIEVF